MLHLARKAFYPAPPPFPLLHIDTTWKFQDMYKLRDQMAEIVVITHDVREGNFRQALEAIRQFDLFTCISSVLRVL